MTTDNIQPDGVQNEPVVDMTQDFHWAAVPTERHEGLAPKALHLDPDLGPIAAFTGEFRGTGFNTIFRPRLPGSPSDLPNPAQPPDDNILQLNLTEETMEFSKPLGSIPNRGFAQPDIFFNGIPYIQKIKDVNDPANKVDIHFEPGVWLSVPGTTSPAEAATVVRMASIPHGTTINAQGSAVTTATGPDIEDVDITPTFIASGSPFTFPSQDADDDHTFRLPQDLKPFLTAKTITKAMLKNPNIVLQARAEQQNITSTTTLSITTRRPDPAEPGDPLFGGGTANIAFLRGDPTGINPNADAIDMEATFWIETVVEQITVPPMGAGDTVTVNGASIGGPVAEFTVTSKSELTAPVQVDVTYTQIQYSQNVRLDFAGLHWPHVSVATLIPASIPVFIPALLTTYTVVAGDTLSGISTRFYGNGGHVGLLAGVNRIANPNLIHVGQVLVIPDLSNTHTVVAGDTLSSISQATYGNAGQAKMLARANRIANPNVIHVGQELALPNVSRTYTVAAGDTLFGIARRFYGRGEVFGFIAAVNGLANPNALSTGQVLVIPTV